MSMDELMEMILTERINSVLQENYTEEEKQTLEQGEDEIEQLTEEQQAVIRAYLNILLDHSCRSNEQVYLAGFEDAIYLFGKIGLIFAKYLG